MAGGYQIYDQHGIHFLTFTVVNWIDVFTRKSHKDVLMESMQFCQKQKGLKVHAYVIMSNHIHVIWSSQQMPLSDIIRDYKKFTATQILQAIQKEPESRREWMLNQFAFTARKNKRNTHYQFWQHNSHPEHLYSAKFMQQKLDYIHQNPVRSGHVFEAQQYVYSSASSYAGNGGLLEIAFLDDWD